MSFDSTWFRCPNCFQPLSPLADLTLGCDSGHRFDISRQGTVTLLPPRTPNTVGDSRAMLEARHRLLESGLFRPIADTIVEAATASLPRADAPHRIADLGCGTGYYATRLAEASSGGTVLAADRSPIAVRMAARSVPRATGVVLDLWQPLPLRHAVADVALNVFSPRNPPEFARILSPRGRLIVTVPTTAHLRQLRAAGALLDIPEGKAKRVIAQFAAVGLSLHSSECVEYTSTPDAAAREQLAGMGPSAHHVADLASTADPDGAVSNEVTVSVEVLVFEHSASRA